MGVRMRVGIVSAVCLGMSTVACGEAAGPAEPGPAAPISSGSGGKEPSEPARGVSWLRVVPEQDVAGSVVSLDVACLGTLGVVHSAVLDIDGLTRDPDGHQPWHLSGTATVRADATPGGYRISTTCDAEELSAAFTVLPTPPR